jgi:hypothetical protein
MTMKTSTLTMDDESGTSVSLTLFADPPEHVWLHMEPAGDRVWRSPSDVCFVPSMPVVSVRPVGVPWEGRLEFRHPKIHSDFQVVYTMQWTDDMRVRSPGADSAAHVVPTQESLDPVEDMTEQACVLPGCAEFERRCVARESRNVHPGVCRNLFTYAFQRFVRAFRHHRIPASFSALTCEERFYTACEPADACQANCPRRTTVTSRDHTLDC